MNCENMAHAKQQDVRVLRREASAGRVRSEGDKKHGEPEYEATLPLQDRQSAQVIHLH